LLGSFGIEILAERLMLTDPNFELIRMKCNNKSSNKLLFLLSWISLIKLSLSEFSSGYLLGDLLGNGAFSEVKFGTSLVSGENFAIKIIDVKQQTQGFDVHRIYTEIDILQSVHHPSIVK
jgi:serine/threonine protein kinase